MVNVLSICFSALFLSNLALAGAGASNPRGRRQHNSHAEAVQKRAAEEYRAAGLAARSGSTAAAVARKRANSRCGPRNSTTTTTTSITSTVTDPIGNPGGDPTTTTTTTTSIAHKHLDTTTAAPPATTTTSGGGGAGGATYSGDGTYYAPGLGSCGVTSSSSDYIVAVSQLLYDTWPGATGNPNNNPICGLFITAYYGTKSVRVKVADRCVGCKERDLDFSPAAFDQLADEALGRIQITWQFS